MFSIRILLISIVFTLGSAQARSITVLNPGFEEPDQGKISNNFSRIPGWSQDVTTDSGVESSGMAGSYRGFGKTTDGQIYQRLGEVLTSSTTYTLTFFGRSTGNTSTITADFYVLTNRRETSRQVIASETFSVTDDWSAYTMTFLSLSGELYLGKDLGIQFSGTSVGVGWYGLDEVALFVEDPGIKGAVSLTQSVTYQGETITMQLTPENLRGANFECWVQNRSGGYDVVDPVAERSYMGTVDEVPGAISCGVMGDDGTFRGAVYFDRGVTWYTSNDTVVDTRGLEYDSFRAYQYPGTPTIQPGQAGSIMYGFDVGIDADYDYFSDASGGSIAATFEHIEYSVCLVRALYMKDVLLQPYLGRVIIRTRQSHDPYAGLTNGDYLSALRTEWNSLHTDADYDVAAGVTTTKVGGGLAWVGVVGTDSRYSINLSNSTGRFDVVWRHEMGHNWGCGHFIGGSPEGKGLMGGNAPARFSGCEAYNVFNHRDSRSPGILDPIGIYSWVDLPPYAAMDVAEFIQQVSESSTIKVLANDYDGNDDLVSLVSSDETTHGGGTVTQQGQTLMYIAPGDLVGTDWFEYKIEDSSGQAATGVVTVACKLDHTLQMYLPMDETAGEVAHDTTIQANHGSLEGDNSFDPSAVTGWFKGGLTFDGSDDYISVSDVGFSSNTVTMAAWIMTEGIQSSYTGLVSNRSSGAANLNFKEGNRLGYHWNNNHWSWNGGPVVPEDQWIFIALVIEPIRATFYMYDGSQLQVKANNNVTHASESFYGSTSIGRDDNGSSDRYFKGALDDVRLYDYSLTQSEIEQLIAGGNAESPNPFDGAYDVLARSVKWAGSGAAISHEVYIGSSYDVVAQATGTSDEYQGSTSGMSFALDDIETFTEYFWRIDSVDGSGGVLTGPVWSFITGDGTGAITREVWTGISGNSIANLTSRPDYPDTPDVTETLNSLEGPTDWSNNYGTRIHGYLIPPTTGNYTFWIAGDDNCQLWLSSDSEPANAAQIAQVSGWTNPRQWDSGEQQSSQIALTAGQPYYIKALHKEGGGGDHISVAWQGPGIAKQVINGPNLMPY